MKKLFFILVSIVFVQFTTAQSYGEIQGKVVDQNDNPLPFAHAYVEQGSKTISSDTDEDGKFKIKPLNTGSYTLKIYLMGYQSYEQQVSINPDEITFVGTVKISSLAIEIGDGKPPVIYGTPSEDKLINPEETSKISVSMDMFKKSPSHKNITNLATVIAPAVKQAPDGTGLTIKGSRTGANVYFIDGVKVMNGQGLPRVPSSGIKRMTIYTGGVPAKYGDVTGGVIVIETKDYFSEYNKRKYSSN